MNKKALGKGLEALIQAETMEEDGIREIGINEIEPNIDQPRKNFDQEKIEQLAESIKKHGLVQPIIVKKEGNIYRIVAGERRWRAARVAGLKTVPAVIKDISSREAVEIALIENLQREDLNPIEEAEAYKKLIEEYGLTQEEISEIVGKSRPAIANSLRLLTLDEEVRKYIINGDLTEGHGKALAAIEDNEAQKKAALEIIGRGLSVRDTEKLVRTQTKRKQIKPVKYISQEILEIEDKLKSILGTKVKVVNKNKKGKIIIEYYSYEEFQRLIELLYSKSLK